MEEAKKLLGRELKPTEEYLVKYMYDPFYYSMDVDNKGDLILKKKD